MEETTSKYSDWEACASLYVAVGILTHHDGIRHSGLEGRSSTTARGLLVLIACKLQPFLQSSPPNHTVDMDALSDLADSFSFSEIRKRTHSVLCDTTSDQDTKLNYGGQVLPIGHMSLYVSFAPSMNDTLRTSLPRKVVLRFAATRHSSTMGDWLSTSPFQSRLPRRHSFS